MKGKFRLMWRVATALVLVLSLSLVMAVPVAASHDSTATVAFTDGESAMQGKLSTLDVEVTNSAGSLGNINEVVIDFSLTGFTSIGKGVEPANWTGVVAGFVITYTAAAGSEIASDTSVTFVPAVTNPLELGLATNPTVRTSDVGSEAELEATEATGWIGYTAKAIGPAGNDITIAYVDAYSSSPLVVSVVGNAISVELADDGTAPTSTATLVADKINGDAAAQLLVGAAVEGAYGDDLVPVMSATALSGGSLEQLNKDCLVTGELEITELLLTVAVTPTLYTSASLASYTIGFTTIGAINVDETITITFPAEYDMAQVGAGDVSVPAYIGIEVVAVVGQAVTITADGTTPIAAASAPVEVTIINDHVKNPPASGDYDIAVATTIGDHGAGEVTITPASFGVVAGTENTVTAGTAFAVTVTALNAEVEAEIDTGYTGAHLIDFSSGATGAPTIPAFEKITFDAGVGTSSAYFVLTVVEAEKTITATDTDTEPNITGESAAITINPATFVKFADITGLGPVIAGNPLASVTVTAQDADGNTVTDYTGTVTWTSTDGQATPGDGLPPTHTFTADEEGIHTFLGSLFILKTVGEQTITVTDAAAVVSKESTAITVTPAAAASIVVAASPDVIEADNNDSATITVTAKDAFGNVDTNYTGLKSITIASSLGTIALANPSFGEGKAETTLISDKKVGTATIRVTSDFAPETTTVKLLPDIGIASIAVTVDQFMILNDGVDERTITATYKDSEDDVVTAAEGADYAFAFSVVDLDTSLSTTDPVNPVAGVATVTLTTTADEATEITVTADGTGALDGTSELITVTAGTHSIALAKGWNLISLPLIPTDKNINTALADLPIRQVRTFLWAAGVLGEKWWIPDVPTSTLSQTVDGQGYWIEMSVADALVVKGSEFPLPGGKQPSYKLYAGWNLIGFKSLSPEPDLTKTGYLDDVAEVMRAIYGYEAGVYFIPGAEPHSELEVGHGYWVAVSAEATIYP